MKAFVAVTDKNWFELLGQSGPLDEVNFWQPSPKGGLRTLAVGEPLLFKLHSPDDYIVGGGFFSYWTSLTVSLAWDAFGTKNGAASLEEMRARIERYRRVKPDPIEEYEIGCVLLQEPFFFTRGDWFPVPDWHPNIVRGRTYDLTVEPGRTLWHEVQARLHAWRYGFRETPEGVAEETARYGKPTIVHPRLGQGTFRVLVTDAYGRRCAVTREKALPVLQTVHIRPFVEGGEHRVDNGLLLRSDLHILFDRGYLTVTPKYRLEVSRRLRTDFNNGEEYFAWRGKPIHLPEKREYFPSPEFLTWHNENRFRE